MAFDIFVSYATEDGERVDKIRAALEAAGIRCWIARRDIPAGIHYGEAIIEGIEGAKALLVVFSSKSNASIHVRNEVERAVSKGIPIITVRIENVQPNRALELFLSSTQWFDAFAPPVEFRLQDLVEDVEKLLAKRTDGDEISDPGRRHRQETEEIHFAVGTIAACSILVSILIWSDLDTGIWLAIIFALIGIAISLAGKTFLRITQHKPTGSSKP